jgi:hypothetical protein
MPRMVRRRTAVLAVAVSALCAVPLASAHALGPAIGPNQYFVGSVTGVASSGTAGTPVIGVLCAGPASTGTPVSGQSVQVKLLLPPVSTTAGFTGSLADSIQADLIYTLGTVVVDAPIAKLTAYSTPAPIPTTIKVPCSGRGEMVFNPEPTSHTAVSSTVEVIFQSTGV